MFTSIEDQIEQVQGRTTTQTQRVLRYVGVLFVTILLFGGLYLAIVLME